MPTKYRIFGDRQAHELVNTSGFVTQSDISLLVGLPFDDVVVPLLAQKGWKLQPFTEKESCFVTYQGTEYEIVREGQRVTHIRDEHGNDLAWQDLPQAIRNVL